MSTIEVVPAPPALDLTPQTPAANAADEKQEKPATSDSGETAPAADAGADAKTEGADKAETPAKRRRDGVQKRFDELTRDKYDLARKLDMALTANGGRAAPAGTNGSKPAAGEPKSADFASYDEYLDARIEWRAEQKMVQREQSFIQNRQRAAQAEQMGGLKAKCDEAEARYPDYREVVEDSGVEVTPAMRDYLFESEKAGDLVYWLSNNPDETARIAKLSPVRQVAALAVAEQKLSTAPRKTVTAAPEPPRTVAGKSAGQKRPDDMTANEYAKWRKEGGGDEQ
jgi:hypothetical protein